MGYLGVTLSDAAEYDAMVHSGLPEAGDLRIITKDNVTKGGKPGAVLTFNVQLRDKTMQRVQAVVTVASLMTALEIIREHYHDHQ